MATYYLAPQLSDAALDLTHIAGENETLQKLEDIHEILRDATPDDRLLAVRDLTDSVHLSMIHCINTAYRAAPSGFSTEVPALLDEHAEFNRATLCYDGAPDDYRRANELYPKYAELRTADAEGVHDICNEIRKYISEHSEAKFALLRSTRRALEEVIISKYFPDFSRDYTHEEWYLMSLLTEIERNLDSLYTIDFLYFSDGIFSVIDGEFLCRMTDKGQFSEVLRYLNRISHYLPHEEVECRIRKWKSSILKHFAEYAAVHIAGTEPSKHMEDCVKLLHDIAEQKDFPARFPNDDRDDNFYELDALLGASMMHCPNGIPAPVSSEYFWYDWGCVGGALERCEGAYHEVIVERAAVALVTKILAHLLENKKVYAAMQWIMRFYLALVLFGNHALDDDEVFKDVMRQIG